MCFSPIKSETTHCNFPLQIKYRLSVKNDYISDALTNLLTGSECTSAASDITFIQDSISLAVSVQK